MPLMNGERDIAVDAFGNISACLATDIRCIATAVLKQYNLLLFIECLTDTADKCVREMSLKFFAAIRFFQVYNADIRHPYVSIALREFNKPVFA